MTQHEPGHDLRAATNRIMEVMQAHKGELLKKPNVVGVAVGFRQVEGKSTETLALVVMVDHKVPQNLLKPEQQIPMTIEGIPIDVQEVGEISAY
jgi:hypothetical protein